MSKWRGFKNPQIGECFFCGKKGEVTYDIGAISPRYRCCKRCIKNQGVEALRNGADEAMAALAVVKKHTRKCGHCGGPMLQPAGTDVVVLWCVECENERRRVAGTEELLPARIM